MIRDIAYHIISLLACPYTQYSYMAQSAQMWRDTEDWRRANWSFHGLILRVYELKLYKFSNYIQCGIQLKIQSNNYNMRLMYICAQFKPNTVIVVNNNGISGWKQFLSSLNTANLTVYDEKAPENSRISLKPEDKNKIRLLNKKQFNLIKKDPYVSIVSDIDLSCQYYKHYFLIGKVGVVGQHNLYNLSHHNRGLEPHIVISRHTVNSDISAQIYNMGKSYIISDIPLNYPVLTIKDELDDAFSVVDRDYMLRDIIHYNNIVFIGENYGEFTDKLSKMRFSSHKIIYFNVIIIDKLDCIKFRIVKLTNRQDNEINPVIRTMLLTGIDTDTITDDEILIIFGDKTQ
jgi:hypothetical protein